MTADVEVRFVLFGADHLLTMILIGFVAVAFPMIMRRVESPLLERSVAAAMGVALVVYEILKIFIRVYLDEQPLAHSLPLHLCGIEAFLVAYILARRSYAAFEVAYFWGMGGTLQAIVTPDLELGFPSRAYVTFFLGHGLAIIGVI